MYKHSGCTDLIKLCLNKNIMTEALIIFFTVPFLPSYQFLLKKRAKFFRSYLVSYHPVWTKTIVPFKINNGSIRTINRAYATGSNKTSLPQNNKVKSPNKCIVLYENKIEIKLSFFETLLINQRSNHKPFCSISTF